MAEIPVGFRALANSERRKAPGAARVGPSDPKEKFSVTIRVRPRAGGSALPDLDTIAATPRRERKGLSREEFAASYGAAQADLDQVNEFAKSHGLTVVESSPERRSVRVSGTAEQLSRAFGVELQHYQMASGTYRSHEGSVYVPNQLADVVESVLGFDNREVGQPLFRV